MDNLEKILLRLKEIRLKSSEKDRMRSFIISRMKTQMSGARKIELTLVSIFSPRHIATAFAAILLIASSGAGVTLAAEKSLPGDVLYSVKTGVNENVRGLLARSEEEKMIWLVEVAERRIDETERLALENRLDAKAETKIKASFEKNTKEINEKLTALGGDNLNIAADITSRLENSFAAHEEILTKLAVEQPGSTVGINSMLDDVKSAGKSVKEVRENFENDIFKNRNGRLKTATSARLKASLDSIKEAEKELGNSRSAGDSTRERARELIEEAKYIVDNLENEDEVIQEDMAMSISLKSAVAATTTEEALTKLHRAVKLSSQAKIMLKAETKLKVRVDFKDED